MEQQIEDEVVINDDSQQLIFTKSLAGAMTNKEMTVQFPGGFYDFEKCASVITYVEHRHADQPAVQFKNCMFDKFGQANVLLDGKIIAKFENLSYAENLNYELNYYKQQKTLEHLSQNANNAVKKIELNDYHYKIIDYGTSQLNQEECDIMLLKDFIPFVFENVRFLEVKEELQIQIYITKQNIENGYFINGQNDVQSIDTAAPDTFDEGVIHKDLEFVLQKHNNDILNYIKPDNANINIVNEILFNEKNIEFSVENSRREIYYIKKHAIDNMLSMNQFATTNITSAKIYQNGQKLVNADSYGDVLAQFSCFEKHRNNTYIIDTNLQGSAKYDTEIIGDLDIGIGCIYY